MFSQTTTQVGRDISSAVPHAAHGKPEVGDGRCGAVPAVCLIHWRVQEAEKEVQRLEDAGFAVDSDPLGDATFPEFLRRLDANPPDAFVIDLSRMPAQGRDIGVALRRRKSTRGIPLVFIGGEKEKVARIQELLPDASYTEWDEADEALRRAIETPPAQPTVPDSAFAAYAGKSLVEKLGIKPHAHVALVAAPKGWEETLGALPEGVRLTAGVQSHPDLALWFARSRRDLEDSILTLAATAAECPVWIAWPKKASSVRSDLSQTTVREIGEGAGLVDYKIASLNDTWSGLLFRKRVPTK